MKTIANFVLVLFLSCCLVSCANIKDDSTRTKTEGSLLGAGLGAGLGALIGGLTGGGRGALIGAGIGAGVGAAGGYAVGAHIADKKAEYARQEDWLDACIAHSEEVNAEVRQYNAKLGREIAALDRESQVLMAKYRQKEISRNKLIAEQRQLQKYHNDSEKTLSDLRSERAKQQRVASEARRLGDARRAHKLDAEIAKLDKEIKQMREYNKRLANISARMTV